MALVENHGYVTYGEFPHGTLDVDQDGLADLVRIPPTGENNFDLQVRKNLGDMSFSPWYSIGTYELDLEGPEGYLRLDITDISDLNGDSYPDLLVMAEWYDPMQGSFLASVYLINNGSGGFTCAGDVTDDGTTDVKDLLGVIADWGCIEEGQPD